jgi:hypothetical protein
MIVPSTGNSRTQRAWAFVAALLALIVLSGTSALAEKPKEKRRVIPVTINKGENYTITGIKQDTAPNSKVVKNSGAMVMQTAPGRIEIVGAGSGSWKIDATLATGEKVTYLVTVKSDTPPQGDLKPVAAPTVIP